MFNSIRETITRNFRDLKLWVSNIPDVQNGTDFQAACYGLFFVYIYGMYEEIIRTIISTTISKLNESSVYIEQCIYELYPLVFAPEYDSLYAVGNEHKWEKRWEISNKFIQNPAIQLPSELFPTDGRNLRIRQLESLKRSFGISDNVLPRPEIGGYIQEMVDNRNDIAHGNKLPKEVGRAFTKQDLLNRCDYISEICSYICGIYESYILNGKYIRQN